MGDDFNMSMPGEPQIGLPGNHLLTQQIQESGLQMNLGLGGIALGVSVVGGLIGGSKSASAARKQAEAQNAATERQLEYDTELWEMSKEKIQANRNFAIDETKTKARNEGKIAAFKDASNVQKYNYDMMIRNREQESLNQQFFRSDDIYNKQMTLNAMSARAGRQDEYRRLQEINAEAAFNLQEDQLKNLIAEGTMRAKGVSGRSTAKWSQSISADLGRKMALVNESLSGAGRNTRSVLKEIARDKSSADLAAYAQKMLDPGVLPTPIVPFATPLAEYLYPRELKEYDYGPKPVLGAMMSPSAAAGQVWGSTISGIAGSVGTIMGAEGFKF